MTQDNFWKNDISWGHKINRLESDGSKMADLSTLTRPWSSISKLNDTPRGTMTVPKKEVKESVSSSIMSNSACGPMDCSLPGSFVHGILQARILERVAIPFSGFSQLRDRTQVSCIADRFFIFWATREVHDSSEAPSKDQKVGGGPIPGNFHLFPQIVEITLPLTSLWNYPAHKN